MNILILLSWSYPSPNAATKRVKNYARGLELKGNSVIFKSIFLKSKNKFAGFYNILFIPYYTLIEINRLKEKPQAIVLYTFGWISKLMITIYGKIFRIKIIFEVNEKPYSIIGSRRDKFLIYTFKFNNWCLTHFVYPMADGFIVISENMKSFICNFKSKKSEIVKIPIVVDYDDYQKISPCEGGIKPYIFHSATLNDNKDGISDVIEAIGLVNQKLKAPLHFYLTSKIALNSTKSKVQKIIDEYELNDFIHYLGDVDEETLIGYQQNCTMVVINKVDSEQNRYNFATKIGEYCAIGKPIITTSIGEVSNYFTDGVNCLFIPKNNPEVIAEKIIFLLHNPGIAEAIGREAKKTALSEFDYKINGEKLNVFFKNIISPVF